MSDPGAPSGAVAEITTTSGTGSYQLSPNAPNALAAYFRFADVFMDGATITYEVDDTQSKEIVIGIFHMLANTLSRDTVLFSSNANTLVDWPATGQRTVRPLSLFPLCDTPPTDGQVLEWDAAAKKWCPATIMIPNVPPGFAVCNTPPSNGDILAWDGAEWCPANLCDMVAACLAPSCNWTWTKITPPGGGAPVGNEWQAGGTISSDGSKIVIFSLNETNGGGNLGKIFRSTNFGSTWSDITPPAPFSGSPYIMKGSADGSTLVVGDGTVIFGGTFGDLWLSTNSGTTWAPQALTSHGQNWLVSMSDDGQKIIAYDGGTGFPGTDVVYVTVNHGASWSALSPPRIGAVQSVLMSRDGNSWFVGADNLYKTVDMGATWSTLAYPPFPFNSPDTVVGYHDASTLFITDSSANRQVYKTSDFLSWSAVGGLPALHWTGIPSMGVSVSDQVVAAGALAGGGLWVSCDGGVTWNKQTIAGGPSFYIGWVTDNYIVAGDGTTLFDIWLGTRA